MRMRIMHMMLFPVLAGAACIWAQPAARVGDMSSHGGMITGPGCPTVRIGGMPAARLGDMHICPMMNGGIPHPPGPIVTGNPTVLIGGHPAARAGDVTGCGAEIVMGCPTVRIGGGRADSGSSGQSSPDPDTAAAASDQRVMLQKPREISPPTVLQSYPGGRTVSRDQRVSGLTGVRTDGKFIIPEGIEIQSTGSSVCIKAGQSRIMITPSGGISIESDQVEIKSTGDLNLSARNVTIEAQMDVDILGTNIHSQASARIQSEGGAGNTVTSSGQCTIQGSLVQIN